MTNGRKPADQTHTAQADRFRKIARELGADQDEGALDRVFGKVVPPVVPKKLEDQEANDG